jgi:hypothetical protein
MCEIHVIYCYDEKLCLTGNTVAEVINKFIFENNPLEIKEEYFQHINKVDNMSLTEFINLVAIEILIKGIFCLNDELYLAM